MSLTLPLTAAGEAKLAAQARAKGTTPEALVRQAIEPILTPVPEDLLEPAWTDFTPVGAPLSQVDFIGYYWSLLENMEGLCQLYGIDYHGV